MTKFQEDERERESEKCGKFLVVMSHDFVDFSVHPNAERFFFLLSTNRLALASLFIFIEKSLSTYRSLIGCMCIAIVVLSITPTRNRNEKNRTNWYVPGLYDIFRFSFCLFRLNCAENPSHLRSMFRLSSHLLLTLNWADLILSSVVFVHSLQPSLSLDNTVEVFLLKNEGDFISVEQGQKLGGEKRKKKREENIRQLLDVTNTITSEEMRDFEMRSVVACELCVGSKTEFRSFWFTDMVHHIIVDHNRWKRLDGHRVDRISSVFRSSDQGKGSCMRSRSCMCECVVR